MTIFIFVIVGVVFIVALSAPCRKYGRNNSVHDSGIGWLFWQSGGGADHSPHSTDHGHTHHAGCGHDSHDSSSSDSGAGDGGGGGDSGGGGSSD